MWRGAEARQAIHKIEDAQRTFGGHEVAAGLGNQVEVREEHAQAVGTQRHVCVSRDEGNVNALKKSLVGIGLHLQLLNQEIGSFVSQSRLNSKISSRRREIDNRVKSCTLLTTALEKSLLRSLWLIDSNIATPI